MPATNGDAMDVPLSSSVSSSPVFQALSMPSPGAYTSRHRPQLEKYAPSSYWSDAPTVIASGVLAGEKSHALRPEFPAATLYTTPEAMEALTASFSAALYPPPSDMFATAVGLPEAASVTQST